MDENVPLVFPVPKLAKYFRIQGDNSEMSVQLTEIRLFGYKIDCNEIPDVVKYGEDCYDNIDNDNDGLTDCED